MDRKEHRQQRTRADEHSDLAGTHAERQAIEGDQEVVELGVAHRERPGDVERGRESGLDSGHRKRLTRPASGCCQEIGFCAGISFVSSDSQLFNPLLPPAGGEGRVRGPTTRFTALPTSPSAALWCRGPSLSPLKGGEGLFPG